MESLIDILIKYQDAFLGGLWVTLQLSLIIWIVGISLGVIIGLMSTKYKKSIGIPAQIFSFLLSGIPILVFLFWLHYPAQSVFNISVDPFYTTALAITLINIFIVSDIIREGVSNLPHQFIEVAKLCNISKNKLFFKIEFPLIFRHVLPSLLMAQVTMLHMTLFASLISVEEIFRIAQRINSIEYKPVEIYTALGIFFLLVSLPINGIALYLKKKFNRDFSER